MTDIKQKIIELLMKELPSSLMQNVKEIELLMEQERYREAYLMMYELRKSQLWSPSSEYIQMMEKFWWDYAN